MCNTITVYHRCSNAIRARSLTNFKRVEVAPDAEKALTLFRLYQSTQWPRTGTLKYAVAE
jgi:hypothetical protein